MNVEASSILDKFQISVVTLYAKLMPIWFGVWDRWDGQFAGWDEMDRAGDKTGFFLWGRM
jgi:hypothetical protein